MASLLRRIQRDAHLISRTAGDAAAYRSGGAPRLVKRIIRRKLTAKLFSAGRRAL